MSSEQRLKGYKRPDSANIWGKDIPGMKNNKSKYHGAKEANREEGDTGWNEIRKTTEEYT